MRRVLVLPLLAILAALVWAPLTVSAADPLASVSPSPHPAASAPSPTDAPIYATLPTAKASTQPIVEPVGSPQSEPVAAPSASTTALPPVAVPSASPTALPLVAAAPTASPVPASTPVDGGAAPSGGGGSTPSGDSGNGGAAPASSSPGSPAPSGAGLAPAGSPKASAASPESLGRPADLPAGLSQTMTITLLGAGLAGLLAACFLLLGFRRRRFDGEAQPATAGGTGEDPEERLTRSAEAAMAARSMRRARIAPSDDPILRAMGLGIDEVGRAGSDRGQGPGEPGTPSRDKRRPSRRPER